MQVLFIFTYLHPSLVIDFVTLCCVFSYARYKKQVYELAKQRAQDVDNIVGVLDVDHAWITFEDA